MWKEHLSEVGDEVGHGGGGSLVEAVEGHNSLLADGLFGVGEEVDHLGEDGGDRLLVDELACGG